MLDQIYNFDLNITTLVLSVFAVNCDFSQYIWSFCNLENYSTRKLQIAKEMNFYRVISNYSCNNQTIYRTSYTLKILTGYEYQNK